MAQTIVVYIPSPSITPLKHKLENLNVSVSAKSAVYKNRLLAADISKNIRMLVRLVLHELVSGGRNVSNK